MMPASSYLRSGAFLLLASSFAVLEALAATTHPHATHTVHHTAAHATHRSGVAHRGKQFLKMILGIVIGCVVGSLLLCVCCCFLFRRRKNASTREATPMQVSSLPPISAPISSQPTNPNLGEAMSYYHPQTTEAPKYGYSGNEFNTSPGYQQGYQGYQAAYDAPPPPPPPPPPQAYTRP